jgi:hypothetical protein
MPGLAASGDGWHERLLDQIARLEMAITGYRRIQELPEDTQADLRAVIGFTIKQEDLKDQPGIHDTWLVLGRDVEEEAGLKTQRTWLWGRHTRRAALVLSFAAGKAILENSLPPGTAFLGDVVFYPGAYPLRGYVREQNGSVPLPDALPGCDTLTQVTAGYAAALAANPWLERYPLAINQVMPARDEDTWVLVDSDGRKLPLARSFLHGWSLMAYSGGQPLGVFGEWNGERLLPLSTWVDGQLFVFPARGG